MARACRVLTATTPPNRPKRHNPSSTRTQTLDLIGRNFGADVAGSTGDDCTGRHQCALCSSRQLASAEMTTISLTSLSIDRYCACRSTNWIMVPRQSSSSECRTGSPSGPWQPSCTRFSRLHVVSGIGEV